MIVMKVQGLEEMRKSLVGASERLNDLSPALKVPAERFKSLIDRSFETSSSPDGTPWEPLKPATVAYKERHGLSAKPLIETGGTRRGIAVTPGKKGILIGTSSSTPYAGVHQFGSKKKKNRPPARPFLPVVPSGGDDVDFMPSTKVESIIEDMKVRVFRWVVSGKR